MKMSGLWSMKSACLTAKKNKKLFTKGLTKRALCGIL